MCEPVCAHVAAPQGLRVWQKWLEDIFWVNSSSAKLPFFPSIFMEVHQLWYFKMGREEELVRGVKAFKGECVFNPILGVLAKPESANAQ